MPESNPFYHRGPIRDPKYYFGRERETAYLFDLLRKGQNAAVCGPRRIGKTSLLLQAQHPELQTANGIDPATTRLLYLDGGTLDGLDEESFYGAVDRALCGDSDSISYPVFLERLRSCFTSGAVSRLILLIDEFELVAANPLFGLSMFNRLRGLTTQYPLQFVTSSKLPLWQLTVSNRETLSSPFFNIFAPLPLGLLEEQDAEALLAQLSANSGNPFNRLCLDFLLRLAGTHPLFLQIAGYRAFEAVSTGGELTESACSAIRQQILSDLEPHLSYYWSELSAEQRYELAALPLLTSPSRGLMDAGLSLGCRYIGEMVETFVRRQSVDGLLQSGPFLVDLRRGQVVVSGDTIHLTPTEYSLLRFFLENSGRVLSPEEIERALWPEDISPDPERARGVIKKLRSALGSAGKLLENRRGQGYLLIHE